MSNVLSTPPASAEQAVAHFATRLCFETDASDVHADLEARVSGLLVVDTRSVAAWEHGHLPGAIHLPTREISTGAAQQASPGVVVVTYCWGPGCSGATRAALEFAKLGYQVKEMLGGYEYWVREGFPVRTASGPRSQPVDSLTAVGVACDC